MAAIISVHSFRGGTGKSRTTANLAASMAVPVVILSSPGAHEHHGPEVASVLPVMARMDGFETLEAIKADPRLRELPVVVISSVEDVASVVRMIEMGALDHLPEPFEPAILDARMRAARRRAACASSSSTISRTSAGSPRPRRRSRPTPWDPATLAEVAGHRALGRADERPQAVATVTASARTWTRPSANQPMTSG